MVGISFICLRWKEGVFTKRGQIWTMWAMSGDVSIHLVIMHNDNGDGGCGGDSAVVMVGMVAVVGMMVMTVVVVVDG